MGTAVAEFALMSPLIFLLIFGFMEGARIFSAWLVLTNEAREGARVAAVVNGQVADPSVVACARVLERANGPLDTSRLTCSVETALDAGGNVSDLTLTLGYSIELVNPVARSLFAPSPVSMAARSSMRPE